jgi:hypothetical protein
VSITDENVVSGLVEELYIEWGGGSYGFELENTTKHILAKAALGNKLIKLVPESHDK